MEDFGIALVAIGASVLALAFITGAFWLHWIFGLAAIGIVLIALGMFFADDGYPY
jgi:hypothetical protein